ncbi:MAG: hypothetical protein MHM6MM_009269, partial [Cercozoa sp. M6MM]
REIVDSGDFSIERLLDPVQTGVSLMSPLLLPSCGGYDARESPMVRFNGTVLRVSHSAQLASLGRSLRQRFLRRLRQQLPCVVGVSVWRNHHVALCIDTDFAVIFQIGRLYFSERSVRDLAWLLKHPDIAKVCAGVRHALQTLSHPRGFPLIPDVSPDGDSYALGWREVRQLVHSEAAETAPVHAVLDQRHVRSAFDVARAAFGFVASENVVSVVRRVDGKDVWDSQTCEEIAVWALMPLLCHRTMQQLHEIERHDSLQPVALTSQQQAKSVADAAASLECSDSEYLTMSFVLQQLRHDIMSVKAHLLE